MVRKKVQFVEMDEAAWKPLPENERLDAYYHLREVAGAAQMRKEAVAREEAELKKKETPCTVIQAECLGSLPASASMSIDERLHLYRPDLVPREDHPENVENSATADKKNDDDDQKKPCQNEPVKDAEEAAIAEELEALRQAKKKRRQRPSTCVGERKKVPQIDVNEAANRPTSAPARMIRKAPVRSYSDPFNDEVRGPPDPPVASFEAPPPEIRGHNNRVFSVVEREPSFRADAKTTTGEGGVVQQEKLFTKRGGGVSQGIKKNNTKVVPTDGDTGSGNNASSERDRLLAMMNTPRKTPRTSVEQAVKTRTVVTFTGTILTYLKAPTPWATVRYTVDGGPVGRGSAIYRKPVKISEHCVLRACACKRGWTSEAVEIQFVKRPDVAGVRQRIIKVSQRVALARRNRGTDDVGFGPTPRERDAAALMAAVKLQHVVRVRKLLVVDHVDPNILPVEGGETPLRAACRTGNVLVAQVLLNHKADPDARSGPDAQTAAHAACDVGAPKVLALLLKKGADPDVVDAPGRAPLHVACGKGSVQCLRILLQAGANVDAATPDGETPLHTACRAIALESTSPASHGSFRARRSSRSSRDFLDQPARPACVKALIDGGAKLDARWKNRRPIQIAHSACNTQIVDMLLDGGAKPLNAPSKKSTRRRR